jgi:hypothetical protein
MADLYRVKTTWSGMPGAPGVSTMYLNATPTAADLTAIRTFFNALVAGLPNTATLQVQGVGDVISDTNGALSSTWVTTAPGVVTGTSASGYAGPTGACVHWLTNGIVRRRRVKGTTYIVPSVNQYDANGTLLGAWVTTVSGAAATMFGAMIGKFVVWNRPLYGPRPGPGAERPILESGSSHPVVGSQVPDKAVVLRTRRD